MTSIKPTQNGFALLLTLVIISVVLAIGLSLLNITMKQFTLSSIARDSEVAFHAANTGIECMRYWRQDPATETDMLNGGSAPSSVDCGGSGYNRISATDNHSGSVFNYQYRFDKTDTNDQCIETSIYLLDATGGAINNFSLADEGLESIDCSNGNVCTALFSRGYNRPCGDLGSIRTVQREITVTY